MDTKGRPTKLEDIISCDSLIEIFKGPKVERAVIEAMKADPTYSIGIRKAVVEFLEGQMDGMAMQLGLMFQPNDVVIGVAQALLICIDDAIRQRAEVDELREMADR